jgi:hypothetical protein
MVQNRARNLNEQRTFRSIIAGHEDTQWWFAWPVGCHVRSTAGGQPSNTTTARSCAIPSPKTYGRFPKFMKPKRDLREVGLLKQQFLFARQPTARSNSASVDASKPLWI